MAYSALFKPGKPVEICGVFSLNDIYEADYENPR